MGLRSRPETESLSAISRRERLVTSGRPHRTSCTCRFTSTNSSRHSLTQPNNHEPNLRNTCHIYRPRPARFDPWCCARHHHAPPAAGADRAVSRDVRAAARRDDAARPVVVWHPRLLLDSPGERPLVPRAVRAELPRPELGSLLLRSRKSTAIQMDPRQLARGPRSQASSAQSSSSRRWHSCTASFRSTHAAAPFHSRISRQS